MPAYQPLTNSVRIDLFPTVIKHVCHMAYVSILVAVAFISSSEIGYILHRNYIVEVFSLQVS